MLPKRREANSSLHLCLPGSDSAPGQLQDGQTGVRYFFWVIITLYPFLHPHLVSFPPQALEHSKGIDFLVCVAGVNPLVGSTLGSSEQVWDKVRIGCRVLPILHSTPSTMFAHVYVHTQLPNTPISTSSGGWN